MSNLPANDLRAERAPSPVLQLLACALITAAADLTAAWLLARRDLGLTGQVLVALLPAPFNVALIALIVKAIRRLDEFQRRVQFEAVALAFVTSGLTALVCGFFQKAHLLGPVNCGWLWVPMTLFYAIGYVIAARNYR